MWPAHDVRASRLHSSGDGLHQSHRHFGVARNDDQACRREMASGKLRRFLEPDVAPGGNTAEAVGDHAMQPRLSPDAHTVHDDAPLKTRADLDVDVAPDYGISDFR